MPLGGLGPTTIGILVMEALLSGAFVSMRWYTRSTVKKALGSDDYILLATYVLQVAFIGVFIASSMYGFGQHNADLGLEDVIMATKIELAGQFIVSLPMGLSKVGVAMFLMRIIVARWQKMMLWFWIVTMMCWSFLLAISCYAQCYPVQGLWDPRVQLEACPLDLTTIAYIMCSWSAAMDFFLAGFPWVVLRGLNMPKRERYIICVSLSLGVFAGICGVVRTAGLGVLSASTDYLYATAGSVMWTSSELTLTIICVSIPVIKPLWGRYLGQGSSDRYYKQSDDSNRAVPAGRSKEVRNNVEIGLDTIQYDGTSNVHNGRAWHGSDTNSDRSILRENQAIQKTREYTVEYSHP